MEIILTYSRVASSNISRLGSYRNRLKSALQVLHMAVFFLASGYYQAQEQGVSNSATLERLAKLEKYWYGQAEVIREEILQEVRTIITSMEIRLLTTVARRYESLTNSWRISGIRSAALICLNMSHSTPVLSGPFLGFKAIFRKSMLSARI